MSTPYMEYDKLLSLIDESSTKKDDVYTKLMGMESNVLEIVNRVSNQSAETKKGSGLLYNMSMMEVLVVLINTWKNIGRELVLEKHVGNYRALLWDNERKIYIGITIVLLGLILFLIDVSS